MGLVVLVLLITPYFAMKTRVVVCFGDSITSGFNLAAPERESYPAQLQELAGSRLKVLNFSTPGATVQKKGDYPIWQQESYQQVMASSPDVIILLLGTNDTKDNNWANHEAFARDYDQLVTLLKNLPSKPQIFLGGLPPVTAPHSTGIANRRLSELSVFIKKYAAKTGVGFVDFNSALGRDPELFIDGLHPNSRGASLIARKVLDVL